MRVLQHGREGTGIEIQELCVVDDIFTGGAATDMYTVVYSNTFFEFERGNNAAEFAANMVTSINSVRTGVRITTQENGNGSWSYLINDNVGASSMPEETVLVKGQAVRVEGSDTGTVSMATVEAGPGDDLIVFNNNSAHNAFDTLVIKEAFGDDILRGFNKEYDKIDMTAFHADGKVKFAFVIQDTPHYGLDGKTLSVASGKSIVLVENNDLTVVRPTYINEFFVFEVISADNTISADDTVVLLGTLNLGIQNFDNNAMTIDNIII